MPARAACAPRAAHPRPNTYRGAQLACDLPAHVTPRPPLLGKTRAVVELYNPTSADVKLADYHLVLYYNGNTKAGANLDNAMRGATIKAFSSFTICSNRHSDKSICDAEDSRVAHNGDDVWELLKGSTLIDTFGVRGIRSNWKVCGVYGGKDKTLIRKPRVTMGAAKWASSSGTSCDNCEWMVWPKDYFENGGTHFHWNQVRSFRGKLVQLPNLPPIAPRYTHHRV